MTATSHFGDGVLAEAEKLRASGLDVNQLAGALCKRDAQGKNYGIGILLGRDGKPMASSFTLLSYVTQEIQESAKGVYLNSDAQKAAMLEAVLRWQGVSEKFWPHLQLYLPSDAGTGAVQTALQAATLLNDKFQGIAVEALGWPAYKALAASLRLRYQEFESEGVAHGENVLPLYQAGPLNTTGRVPSEAVVQARAKQAKSSGAPVVLDRAYSGFELARRLDKEPYAAIMAESFRRQVQPFFEAGVPVAIAISPTKAFVTFALRPCGLLLIFHPDPARGAALAPKLAGLIRARGSSFEHPVTRAFVKAMVKDRAKLEAEHAEALKRTAEAERQWLGLTKGTTIESLFSESYAGLFRNPKAKPEAARELYGAHIYPVFSDGRCRLNVTGLPADPGQAAEQVSFFSKYCEA